MSKFAFLYWGLVQQLIFFSTKKQQQKTKLWLASDENEKEVAQYTKTPKEQRKVTLATTISMRI